MDQKCDVRSEMWRTTWWGACCTCYRCHVVEVFWSVLYLEASRKGTATIMVRSPGLRILLFLHELLRILGLFRSWQLCDLQVVAGVGNCWWESGCWTIAKIDDAGEQTWSKSHDRHDLKLLFNIPVGHRQSHTGVINPMHCIVPGIPVYPDKSPDIPIKPHIFRRLSEGWPFFKFCQASSMDLAVPPSLLALVDELEAKRVMTVNHWFALIYGLIMALYISLGGG